ncbi:MAG: type III polyketide synthase [Ktedonobacterales bacterium]
MTSYPRILTVASALPPYHYTQQTILDYGLDRILGADWSTQKEKSDDARLIRRLFEAAHVQHRQSAVDLLTYYAEMPTTGARMETYQVASYQLGRQALEKALRQTEGQRSYHDISDFIVVSCTGYSAPGLDIQLARDLGMPRDVRRLVIGHMGCFGALAGLRQSLAAIRAHPGATAAMLSVELSSLHFSPGLDPELLTSFALFGDAAAAILLSDVDVGTGPELIDTYCEADFAASDQMSWTITDQGFVMTLSPRVPITLRHNVQGVTNRLLAAHGLAVSDVRHWIIHPGGPSILDTIGKELGLSSEQTALSWQILRDHGNCSSPTVLLILEALLRGGQAKPGEWGMMMAFGPGLTLETALLRF